MEECDRKALEEYKENGCPLEFDYDTISDAGNTQVIRYGGTYDDKKESTVLVYEQN